MNQFTNNFQQNQQLARAEQVVQQLIQQTQQASAQYQQLLKQEQENAAMLQQLAQREQHASSVIQTALQGHQTALQQLQQISGICNQASHSMVNYSTPQTHSVNYQNQQQFQ